MRDYTNQDEVTEYTNTTRPEPGDLSLDGEQAPTRDLIAKLPGQKPAPAPAVEDFTQRSISRFNAIQGVGNEPTTVTVAQFFDEVRSDQHKAVCDFLRSPQYQSQSNGLNAQHEALIEKKQATQDPAGRAAIDADRDKVKQALPHSKRGSTDCRR